MEAELDKTYSVLPGFLPVGLGEYPEKIGVIMVASDSEAVVA